MTTTAIASNSDSQMSRIIADLLAVFGSASNAQHYINQLQPAPPSAPQSAPPQSTPQFTPQSTPQVTIPQDRPMIPGSGWDEDTIKDAREEYLVSSRFEHPYSAHATKVRTQVLNRPASRYPRTSLVACAYSINACTYNSVLNVTKNCVDNTIPFDDEMETNGSLMPSNIMGQHRAALFNNLFSEGRGEDFNEDGQSICKVFSDDAPKLFDRMVINVLRHKCNHLNDKKKKARRTQQPNGGSPVTSPEPTGGCREPPQQRPETDEDAIAHMTGNASSRAHNIVDDLEEDDAQVWKQMERIEQIEERLIAIGESQEMEEIAEATLLNSELQEIKEAQQNITRRAAQQATEQSAPERSPSEQSPPPEQSPPSAQTTRAQPEQPTALGKRKEHPNPAPSSQSSEPIRRSARLSTNA